MKKKIGALFDLDGVILDTETEYTRIWGEIDRCFPTGIENFPLVIKGTTLPDILERYYSNDEIRQNVIEMLRSKEKEMIYNPIRGAFEFLKELKFNGISTAVVTSSTREKMSRVYYQLPDFENYFETIVTAEDVSFSKPHPQGYMMAAERIGRMSKNCCVFEDSFSGIEAGKRAGGAVVGLATTNSREALEEVGNILIINDFTDMTVDLLLKHIICNFAL